MKKKQGILICLLDFIRVKLWVVGTERMWKNNSTQVSSGSNADRLGPGDHR